MQLHPRFALLSGLMLCCSIVFAVGTTGTIVGTITDPSGRVIPSARVNVRNQDTNSSHLQQTNGSGDFSLPLLPPGHYEVTVEAPNFRRAVYTAVALEVNETVRVDVQLQLGELTQEIIVTDAPLLVQSDSSTIGHTVDRQKITQLPLNERNFLAFTLLVPGAQLPADGSQNSTQGAALNVNGAREQSNNFLLDGVDNNDLSINFYSVLPPVDAIQEFQVQASNSSAEFGRSGGAQINAVLRSGTNELHGSVFWFFRNRHLDARNFFDKPGCGPSSVVGTCGDIPRFDRNQFGATIGGPIQRNRTFYFLSYEGLRLRQAITRRATVPSLAQRQATLAAVPASQRNPAGQAILDLFPLASVGPDLTRSNLFIGAPVLRSSVNQFLLKLNHTFRPSDVLVGHYAFFDEDRFNPYDPFFAFTSLPGFGSFSLNRGQNAGITLTHTFTNHLINELRLGFNRLSAAILQQSDSIDRSRQLGFPSTASQPIALGYPNVAVAGFDGIGEPINTPQHRFADTFHLAETLAWNPAFGGGHHQFKFGADLRRVDLIFFLDLLARGEWQFLGAFSGNPLIDLLRGAPTFAIGTSGDSTSRLRTYGQNFFVQDDIHLHPRLTLNLGLRYEYNSPPVEARNKLSVPDLSANSAVCAPQPDCQFLQAGTHGVPRATFEPKRDNFAPRVGFAWRPLTTDRLVLRSAYGIFYDVGILNINVGPRFNPPFFNTIFYPNTGTNTIQNILQQTGAALTPIPLVIARDYHEGYVQHWNFNVQGEITKQIVLDAAYVGSKGTGLARRRNLNQPIPGGAPPLPQFGPWQYIEAAGSSTYHSLQLRAEHRLNHGLTFLAAYTWSKSLDDSSGIFGTFGEPAFPQNSRQVRLDCGLSNFDTRHRFVLSHVYDLPLGRGGRWLKNERLAASIFGDWRFAGIWTFQSGRPFTVNRGIDQSGTGSLAITASDRPDQIADPFRPGPVLNNPDPACRVLVSQGGRAPDVVRDPSSWFNPCAFAAAPGRFGSAGRNTLIGPRLSNIDISLMKEFPLGVETRRLQFRFEFFNVANHPNLDIPDRVFDSPTFGQVRSANAFGNHPPRQIQLALKYLF